MMTFAPETRRATPAALGVRGQQKVLDRPGVRLHGSPDSDCTEPSATYARSQEGCDEHHSQEDLTVFISILSPKQVYALILTLIQKS